MGFFLLPLGLGSSTWGAFAVELGDAELLAFEAELAGGEEVLDGVGRFAVAVVELAADVVDGGLVERAGDALVHAQALIFFGDVVGVDAHGDAEVEDGGGVGGLFAVAFEFVDGLFEHAGIHLEADGFDVAGLLAAEHVACAAKFEVECGDFEAGSEVGELLEGGEATAGDLGEFGVGRDEEIGVGPAVGAADAAAELVELR